MYLRITEMCFAKNCNNVSVLSVYNAVIICFIDNYAE